jgi:hypothetical protein
LGGLFFLLAALAKRLRSPTMSPFDRLASNKNRLAESNNLLFAHSLVLIEMKLNYSVDALIRIGR